MIGTEIKRIIKNAFLNFWRNGWVSLATVLVMVLAIFMAGSLILFQVLLGSTLDQVKQKVDISVYFKTDSEESDILSVKKKLESKPEVASVVYTSRDDVLKQFRETHKNNALISSVLDELGANPLEAILKVQAHDTADYELINKFLEDGMENGNFAAIDKVNYRQNKRVFDKITSILSATKKVGVGVSVVLAGIAFLVAFNTIRLAIFTSRDEIGIRRLVGASTWYVRGPFLVEGVIHGFFAAVIATVLFWPLTLWLGPKAKEFFGGVDLFNYYAHNVFQFFFVLLLLGIVLGVVSSFIATRRYLKI